MNAIKMTSYTPISFRKAIKCAIKRLSLIGLFLLHFPFFKIWYSRFMIGFYNFIRELLC